MLKKLFKILFISFTIFLLLLVGAVITLKMMYPPKKLRAIIEPKLTEIINRDAKIKNASLSFYPTFGLKIEGLRLSNTSRTIKVKRAGGLWAYLKKANLKKKLVHVTLNGKERNDVAKVDLPLKPGDVLIVSRKGFRNKEAMFSLGSLFVDVKIMPLVRRKVVIKKIVLDKLQILVEVDRRGSFNFDDLVGPPTKKSAKKPTKPTKPTKKSTSQPLRVRLNSFQIKDSRIVYYNRKARQEIILGDINQTLSVKFNSSMTNVVTKGLLEIKRMTIRGRGLPVRKSGMYFMMRHKLHVDLKAGNLRIDDFAFGLKKTVIAAKGAVKGFNKKVKHLKLSIHTNTLRLHDLYREVPPAMFPQARKMKVKGTAKLSLSVKGKIGKPGQMPGVRGRFRINKAYIKYADLPKAIHALNANILFTTNSLNVKKLAFKLGKNPVSVLLKVINFKKPVVDALLKANIDLATLKDAVKLPKGVSVQGLVKANIRAKGTIEPKNPEAIAVKGKIDLTDVVAKTPAVKKPVQVDGSFLFSNQEISLDELTAKIGRSAFTLDMKIRDYLSLALPKKVKKKTTAITFSMTSPYLNVDEILGSQKGSKSKGGTSAGGTSSGSSKSTGDEPIKVPNIPNLTAKGTIRVKKLIYAEMPITRGAIDFTYKNGKIIFDLGASLYTGRIKEGFVVDVSNPKRITVRNKLSGRRIEANDFISNMSAVPKDDGKLMSQLKNMKDKIFGRLNLVTDIRTHGSTINQLRNNLTGGIVSRLRRARIKNATFLSQLTSPLPTIIKPFIPNLENIRIRRLLLVNMKIKKGRVYLKKLRIPLRKLALNMYGSVGLDNTVAMKVDFALGRWISRKIIRQQRRLQRAAGGLVGKIGGGKIGGMLKGQLSGALGKVLIPTDKRGRVTPIIGIRGSLSKPQYYLAGFKGKNGNAGASGGGKSIADSAKKLVKDQVRRAKRLAKRALRRAKQKALKAAERAKKRALKLANDAKKKALKLANEAKKNALRAAQKAKADARKQAEKLKREAMKKKAELQKKAKDAANKAKKGLGNLFGR